MWHGHPYAESCPGVVVGLYVGQERGNHTPDREVLGVKLSVNLGEPGSPARTRQLTPYASGKDRSVPLLRAQKPRHAKPSKAAPVLAAGGMTATLGVAFATPAHAASEDDFARLRHCESGGNYAANTGNGFYGAYQFDLRTWHGQGYSGVPSDAAPGTQDAAAQSLQAQRGWQPWPACSRKLGLGRSGELRASRSALRTVVRHVLVAHPDTPSLRPTTAPAFEGAVLDASMVAQNRPDVRRWQHRMAARGWDITVDGRFGPQSAHIAARFAAEKGLKTAPGTVDHQVWTAAWEMSVA